MLLHPKNYLTENSLIDQIRFEEIDKLRMDGADVLNGGDLASPVTTDFRRPKKPSFQRSASSYVPWRTCSNNQILCLFVSSQASQTKSDIPRHLFGKVLAPKMPEVGGPGPTREATFMALHLLLRLQSSSLASYLTCCSLSFWCLQASPA